MDIHQAARHGDKTELLRNLDAGVSVNLVAADSGWATPLIIAAASPRSDVSILRVLFEHGANVNATAEGGHTALSAAKYQPEKAKFLIDHGANPVEPNNGSKLVFPGVADELARYFLDLGIDPKADPDRCNSALEEASRQGDWKRISLFYGYGCKPEDLGWSPLMNKVVFGTVQDVEAELLRSFDLTARDSWDRTPFLLSACVGDIAKASLLIQHGSTLEERGRCEKHSLQYAAECGSVDMITWLLSKGVDVNVTDEFGGTAVFTACEIDQAGAVSLLLESGACLDLLDQCDIQAINVATSAAVVELLYKAGADINYVDGTGSFPLKKAAEEGNEELVRTLLRLGASVNNVGGGVGTALSAAVNVDDLIIIQLLLNSGADPNIEDSDSWRALWYVKSLEAARLLVDAGASLKAQDEFSMTAITCQRNLEIRSFLQRSAPQT